MLLYPSNKSNEISSNDFISYNEIVSEVDNVKNNHACALGKVSIFKNNNGNLVLDESIGETILNWFS